WVLARSMHCRRVKSSWRAASAKRRPASIAHGNTGACGWPSRAACRPPLAAGQNLPHALRLKGAKLPGADAADEFELSPHAIPVVQCGGMNNKSKGGTQCI